MSDKATTVFIAEDDDLICMVLEDILDELGCEVVGKAATVSEASRFAAANSFDLAIVDVRLKDGSIEPFADELARRNVPFALATGFASQELIARYRGTPVLHKPYLIDDVKSALAALRTGRTVAATSS